MRGRHGHAVLADQMLLEVGGNFAMRHANGMAVVVLVNADVPCRVNGPAPVLIELTDKVGVHRTLLLALRHGSPNRPLWYLSGCTGCQGKATGRAVVAI